jgi:hypothetical protein
MSSVSYKYATQAAVAAASFQALAQMKGWGSFAVPMMNIDVPPAIVGAVLGVGGAVLADVAHDYVVPHLSKDDRLRHVEGAVFAPAVSAAAFAGGIQILNSEGLESTGLSNVLLHGAATELVAQWIYENIVAPYVTDGFKESNAF